jgi:hypothetical protein
VSSAIPGLDPPGPGGHTAETADPCGAALHNGEDTGLRRAGISAGSGNVRPGAEPALGAGVVVAPADVAQAEEVWPGEPGKMSRRQDKKSAGKLTRMAQRSGRHAVQGPCPHHSQDRAGGAGTIQVPLPAVSGSANRRVASCSTMPYDHSTMMLPRQSENVLLRKQFPA